MKNLRLLIALFVVCPTLHAQNWVTTPVIRICVEMVNCHIYPKDQVPGNHRAQLDILLSAVPAKSTFAGTEALFGRKALSRTPDFEVDWEGKELKSFRATWLLTESAKTTLDPHVDVYFIEGRAYMLKAWLKGMRERIEIYHVQ